MRVNVSIETRWFILVSMVIIVVSIETVIVSYDFLSNVPTKFKTTCFTIEKGYIFMSLATIQIFLAIYFHLSCLLSFQIGRFPNNSHGTYLDNSSRLHQISTFLYNPLLLLYSIYIYTYLSRFPHVKHDLNFGPV